MYAPFFGLQHAPFSIAPDPRYLFMSERHREALAHLLYGLDAGGGFVLLTGDIGTGKTTVCRCFLEQIPAHCNVAYIFNPKLTVNELLRSICDEFGVAHTPAVPGAETVKDCLDPLNAFLLAQHAAGRNNVLIIDEAQNLAPDVLEQLRLLTNLETSERKLLQIILIGQPELRDMVADPALEQLAQRVIARFHLDALSLAETGQYIAHRMTVAGLTGPLPFDRRAIQRVHVLARGVPRRINLLCDRALLGAYSAGVHAVSETVVRRAAREVFGASAEGSASWQVRRWAPVGAGALAGALAVGGVVWSLGAWPVGGSSQPRGVGASPATSPASSASSASSAPRTAREGGRPEVRSGAATPWAAASPFVATMAPGAAPALQQFLHVVPPDDAQAWQTLAAAWGARAPDGASACAALPAEGLQCYRNRRAGLALVRQIDRPVLLRLHPSSAQDASVAVVLRQLDGPSATLEAGGHTLRVSVAELAQVWRGDLATLWRSPHQLPDSGNLADSPAGAAWLDSQWAQAGLGDAGMSGAAPLTPAQRRTRIHQFQLTQGLTPDGWAGPLTLMLLNRAVGVNEPRLRNGA